MKCASRLPWAQAVANARLYAPSRVKSITARQGLLNLAAFLSVQFVHDLLDVLRAIPLEHEHCVAGLDETRPKLMNFLARIHARPAYQRALEKGGAYRFAD